MYRLALKALTRWKDSEIRRPMLIRGARQVGKSWLVQEHGKSYETFLEINLERQPEFIPIFKEYFGKPDELIKIIQSKTGVQLFPKRSLLFLDEVQDCSESILFLRYVKEMCPEYHVIAAGSLIEFTLKEISFPVGRIEFLNLFPMNFEEYLIAKERPDLLRDILGADEHHPLPTPTHIDILKDFSTYSLLGGLPEVVETFLKYKDLSKAQEIQQIAISNYRADFYKYATKIEVEYIRRVFDSVPRLLGQKFKYVNVDRNSKSRDLSHAFFLLMDAGLVYPVYHSSGNGVPLYAQIDSLKFKAAFVDVGLCHRILGLKLLDLMTEKEQLLANRGAIAEQVVAQEILSYTQPGHSPEIFYWHRENKSSTAEIDLLTTNGEKIVPIEIKSGSDTRHKSLNIFIEEKREFIGNCFKVSTSNFKTHQGIVGIPFYALMKYFKD